MYINILPNIVTKYNNKKHSSIKMSPIAGSKPKNIKKVYYNLFGKIFHDVIAKYKIGDIVRISKYERKQLLIKVIDLIGVKNNLKFQKFNTQTLLHIS